MSPELLIVIGAVIGLGAMLILATRRRPSVPGLFAREEHQHAREQLGRLLTDMQDLSREHIARLDTKTRMLQQLLGEADAKIRDLRAAIDRSAPAAPPQQPSKPSNPLHERVYALADGGATPDAICAETGLEKGEVELILGLRKVERRP